MQRSCQLLESRRLLAATLDVVTGFLTVNADDQANVIDVALGDVSGADRVIVTIDGVQQDFNPDQVMHVLVFAAHGSDLITIAGVGLTREVFGEGDGDTILGSSFADTIDGGGGPDRIHGGAGNDKL